MEQRMAIGRPDPVFRPELQSRHEHVRAHVEQRVRTHLRKPKSGSGSKATRNIPIKSSTAGMDCTECPPPPDGRKRMP